jgi:asparagine synthase (glutamine-hydrolysing)
MLPLLPTAILDLLRSGRRNLALGGADIRVDNAGWLTDALRNKMEKRRNANPNIPASIWKRRGQHRQRQLLADAYIPLASELEERMASRVGLELRHPMQSSRLMEFAVATPERLRIRGRTNKFMHVRAMQDVLPKKVLSRKTKADFSILFRQHLEPVLREFMQDSRERRASWIESDGLQALIEQYRERLAVGKSSSGGKAQWVLWNLLICDLWVDMHTE